MTPPLCKEEIRHLLEERFKDDPYKSMGQLPHPQELKDSKTAAKLIIEAIKKIRKFSL